MENVENFLMVNFFVGGGGYIDSDINITWTSPLPLSMNPWRFEAKENSV